MKKSMKNDVHIEGRLYQHNLALKKSGPNSKNPGTEYISGTIDVATDDNITNIITTHYTYVTAKFSSGKDNSNFGILKDIIDGKYNTVMDNGAEAATKVRIDTSVSVNDFYTDRQLDENKEPTLVSAKRNEGGFIRIITGLRADVNKRNTFETDILINGFTRKEADDEKGTPEKGIIKGAIFDFRNALMPVEYTVLNPRAIDYFEGLEPSEKNPVFTRVSGVEVSEVVKKTITTEGAFGDEVREVESTRREFVVTWAQPEVYEFDTPETITKEELKKAVADRETYLASVKERYLEYKNNAAAATSTSAAAAAGDTFNF